MTSPRISLIIEDGSTEGSKIQHRRHFSSPAKLDRLSKEITPEGHNAAVKGSVPMVGSLVFFRPKSLPCSDRDCAVHNNPGKSDKFRRYSSSALSRSSSSSCISKCEHHVKLTPLEDYNSNDEDNEDGDDESSIRVSQHLAQYHLGEESPNPSLFEAEVGPRSVSATDLHSIGGSMYKEGSRHGTLFDFVDSKIERDRRKSFCSSSSIKTASQNPNILTPNTHQTTNARANRHRRRLTCAMVFEEPKVVEI